MILSPRVADCEELGEGDTIEMLVAELDFAFTQAATGLSFLLERGIITTERRRNYPATIDVHLDAMTEHHALLEKGPADEAFEGK